MLTEQLKHQALHHMVHRAEPPPDLRDRVKAFLFQDLGVAEHDDPYWPVESGRGFHWTFWFDAKGWAVPSPHGRTPYETVRGYHAIAVAVSRCGPYVTAQSYRVEPFKDGGTIVSKELLVSREAIELAHRVAQRFGLTYLDAAELYAWELDESVADAAGVDFEDEGWERPNAFMLLF